MMNITKHIKVPTGDILCAEGDRGDIEFLSVGDYGKAVNIKADFLDLSYEPKPFKHTAMLPLTEKWVITISTQHGCSMGCEFCDVPLVGKGTNVTLRDLQQQILTSIDLHPEITWTQRLNVHFARMGEPTFNIDVLRCAEWLHAMYHRTHAPHPVVSTMMPKHNPDLYEFLNKWMRIKSHMYHGNAGLQLSINSTCQDERRKMFNGNEMSLIKIVALMNRCERPKGRKITLNFAVAGYEIDAKWLAALFDPEYYICKLTPMHKTIRAEKNNIRTGGDFTDYYPYRKHEEELKAEGFDVLVFLASEAEDLGRITCGNALLSGTMPAIDYEVVI